jgi:hypothetical protein
MRALRPAAVGLAAAAVVAVRVGHHLLQVVLQLHVSHAYFPSHELLERIPSSR